MAPTRTNRPKKVPLHLVADALRVIHDKNHSKQFMKEAADANVVVTVHANTLDFMKNYITTNKLHNFAATKKIVLCPNPNDCPPPKG